MGGSTLLASRHTQKMSDRVKTCANRACTTPQLPVKGDFCTAGKCKRARAALLASKKMCVVGVTAPAALRSSPRTTARSALRFTPCTA